MPDKVHINIPDQSRDARRFQISKAFAFREHALEAYRATGNMPLAVSRIFQEGVEAAEKELDSRIKDYSINHLGMVVATQCPSCSAYNGNHHPSCRNGVI